VRSASQDDRWRGNTNSAPHDWRTTSSVGKITCLGSTCFPRTAAMSISVAHVLIASIGARTVVKRGVKKSPMNRSSYPTIAMSSGMRNPRSDTARIAPRAILSLLTKNSAWRRLQVEKPGHAVVAALARKVTGGQ